MSVQFLQSTTPQENQTIRVNDCIVRGNIIANNDVSVAGNLSTTGILSFQANIDGAVSGQIQLPALQTFVQATATNANVAASVAGVAPQQFKIATFETSPGVGGDLAAGASVSFNVFHSGIVAGKTIVLLSKSGSYNGNLEVNAFVGACTANEFVITRHNFGATTASGTEEILVKLIQTA
jgi:hypothetical protein